MMLKILAGVMLLGLQTLTSCSNDNVIKTGPRIVPDINSDGITVSNVKIYKDYFEMQIYSINPMYNCINKNGISGSDFGDAEKDLDGKLIYPVLLISKIKYGGSSVKYGDNDSGYHPIIINKKNRILKFYGKYNFVSFSIFDCEKVKLNLPQNVYSYVSNPYDPRVKSELR